MTEKKARWEVTAICLDLPATETKGEPVLVVHEPTGKTLMHETITRDNAVFQDCATEWEVADVYEWYWNRINDSDIRHDYNAHTPTQLVKVLWVREVP